MKHLANGVLLAMMLASAPQANAQEMARDTSLAEPLDERTIATRIDTLMRENELAGVVYVERDAKVVVREGYGLADPATGRANTPDTIFGIGSRPIDFTTAAILLLMQRGEISGDDRLDKFYPDAPDDKAAITIRHLLNGQSGLPDFPADESVDWDPDLAWIDRAEFERRTLAAPLLFAPGAGEAHSHWAFGVLAAIVERVSGGTYEDFLRTEFFDPAGMVHTGNYGECADHSVADFAVGGGKQVGLPNIPPNWGPTSWLVKGSGGMYSNLEDLLRFYRFVTKSGKLTERYSAHFREPSANVDGSERGFDLISLSSAERRETLFVFLNKGGPSAVGRILEPLIDLVKIE